MRREAGQGGEEAQLDLGRLGLRHEGQDQHPEWPDAAVQGLGNDGDRLVEIAHDSRHHLIGEVIVDELGGAQRGGDRSALGEGGPRWRALNRYFAPGQQRRMATAGQAEQRALTNHGHPESGRLGTEGTTAAGDGGPSHIAGSGGRRQGRAEVMQVLHAFEVVELNQGQAGTLDGLGGRSGNGEEEALVGFRHRTWLDPMDDEGAHGPIRDDQRDHGQGIESVRIQGLGHGRPVAPELGDRLGEQRDVLAQDIANGTIGIHGKQDAIVGFVGVVAEPGVHGEDAPVIGGGEGGGIDMEFVAQGAEDGLGHLARVGRRGQGAGHGLHPLGRLGGDPPPALVPGLGAGGHQLSAALRP